MNVKDFLKLSENISVPQIYKNLATLKCEEEEIESFKKFIPVLVDLTYAFLHSLDNDRIIFAKQAYEDLKAFIKTIDNKLLKSKEFKKLIHQWENATNYHLLYMPLESFVHNDEDVMSKDDMKDDSDAISKWKRISKFKNDVQNRLDNSNDLNRHNTAEAPKKSTDNLAEKNKDEINIVSLSNSRSYGLKLMLLAHKKRKTVKPHDRIILEDFKEFDDILVLETDVVDDLPVYSIFSLLIFQNDGAQISTRQLTMQRLSLIKYFCIFNEIRVNIQLSQIKMFCLHTNAALDAADADYFNNVCLPVIFDQKPSLRCVLKNDESVLQMLRRSVDMNYLVDDFVKHIVNSTKRSLNSPLLNLYRVALIKEKVIDESTSQFHARFLEGHLLSKEAYIFRQKLIDVVKQIYQFNEEGVLVYMKNIIFTLSNNFFQDDEISCYKNFKIFSTGINICHAVDSFVEKFALAVNQPNEFELNYIIEHEFGKRFLLLDAEFITSNTKTKRRIDKCLVKVYYTSDDDIFNGMVVDNYIQKIQLHALTSPLIFLTGAISPNLNKKLSEFMVSDKAVLVVMSNIPFLSETMVKKYLPSQLFIVSSLLQSLFCSNVCADLLSNNHLIVRDDGKTESFKIEDLLKNLSNMEVKTKTVVIVPKENFIITEKMIVDDKTDFYDDLIDFSKWSDADKTSLTVKTVEFQNKKVMVKDLIIGSEELITPLLIEKLCKDEKIIIGNNQKFCDYFNEETYIPRTVWKENGYYQDSYLERDLIDFDDNPVIIVGSMGLGKTSLLTKLSKDIMHNKEELIWVVMMDLKDYCNLLDTIQFCDNMDNGIFFYESDKTNPDFAEILLRSMLTIPPDLKFLPNEDLNFELNLFKDYFFKGNLCIVIDGFGEIPKCYHQKMLHFLIKLANETNNKLIISSTPEFLHLLEYHICSTTYILKPFTEEDREKFVKNYWIKKHGLSLEQTEQFYADFNKSVFLQTDIFEPYSPLLTWITAGFWLLTEKKEKCSNVNKEMQLLLLMLLFPGALNSNKSNFNAKLLFSISDPSGIMLLDIFQSMQLAHFYKSYQRIAMKQLLQESLLADMLSKFKEDSQIAEESIFDNVENFLFLSEKNGELVFIHSIFAEYFAATFLFDNLNILPQASLLEAVNFLLQKTSKAFGHFIFELFPKEWQERFSHPICLNQKLLAYSVTKNLETVVKYLVKSNHKHCFNSLNDEFVYFDWSNLQSSLENAAENHTNLLEILLQPYQLGNNEEHLVRQNKFLTLKLTDYVSDFIIAVLLKNQNYEILKELIFARKKISDNTTQMKSAPRDFQTFTYSIGFLYDFDWTMSVIASDKKIFSQYYDDYSLDTDDLNIHIQITPREILKKLITPQYTPLDLINKSHYYSDEEKLVLTNACINAGGNAASWSYKKGDFDQKCSYIICILQAAIAHGHFKTFKYFLEKEKVENYYFHLLTAAKFSQNTIIYYLLNYHYEDIIQNKNYSLLHFMELFSSDEIKFNIVFLHFPVFKQEFINPYKLISTAVQNPSKLIIIKNVIEQCQDEKTALAERLARIALGYKGHEITYCLCLIFNLDIPEAAITLHNAVKNGDFTLAAEIIKKFDNVNEQDDEGNTPLHYAGKNVEIVTLLLENGAIYNSLNKKFKVPIESCYATTDAYDLLKEVESAFRLQIRCYNEENIASIFNARNFKKQTFMHAVLETGSQDEIKHVIETYSNKCRTYLPAIMNSVDFENNKPLHIAVRTKNFAVFKKLLEYGALFDEKTKEIINEMVDDERKHDRDDKTLEFKSFLQKYGNACKFLKSILKENDKDVTTYLNCKDENEKTVMHYAVESGILDTQMVKTLVKLKANFNIVDKNNFTPLDLVIKLNDKRQYLILIKAGIKLNVDLNIKGIIPECDEYYCFYKTIYKHILNDDVNGLLKVAKAKKKFKQFLLANVRDTDGNTLLHHAVKHNSFKSFLLLLQKGVPFNVTNKWGNSAENLTTDETIKSILQAINDLFYAVQSKKTRFLPEVASNVLNKDFVKNKKILHQEYIKSIFMNAREQTCDENIYNVKTLLHQAVKHGKLDIVRWLIINGARPLAKDFYQNTALQIAKEYNHIDVTYYLRRIQEPVHVGVAASLGRLSYYINEVESEITISPVDHNKIEKVSLMFEEIKSKIDGKFGSICFCLDNYYDNVIRKTFIQSGLKCGFKKVEIIHDETALYLYAMSQIKYKPLNGNVIWIQLALYIYVFEVKDSKALFIGNWYSEDLVPSDLEKIVNESKTIKGPDFVLHHKEIDKKKFAKFPICRFFLYNYEAGRWSSKGSLIKARITANDQRFAHLDTIEVLSKHITMEIGDTHIKSFKKGEQLPLIYSTLLMKKSKNDVLKIKQEFCNTEFIDFDKIYLTFQINVNKIYSVTFEDKPNKYYLSHERKQLDERISSDKTVSSATSNYLKQQQSCDGRLYDIPQMLASYNTNINAVGIDLGTSRCCVAVNRKNGIETVSLDDTGERFLPSYVVYDEENAKCGRIVVNRLRYFSKSTIFDSKRIIGKKIYDIHINESWPFKILDFKGKVHLEVEKFHRKETVSPEEVSAVLLKHIKQKAEEFQGRKLTEAVICVPAVFTESQKTATIEAAKLAGWEQILLLPEPVASAFAYFINRPIPNNSNVLLFDLGGGKLDVCILKFRNNKIEIISNTGDCNIGGRDFDNILINYFKNILLTKYGISLIRPKLYLLMLKCQEIKEALSIMTECWLDVDDFDPNQDGIIHISRDEFQNLAKPLLNKVKIAILSSLDECNFQASQIDKVLRVGGGSRMSLITSLLQEIFPFAEHCCEENPDELVAIGAAYYAYYLNTKQ